MSEFPIQVKADVKAEADLTEPTNRLIGIAERLVDRGLHFASVVLGPAAAGLNYLTTVIERKTARLDHFAETVEQLQIEQNISDPAPIPDKVQQKTLQAVSVEDDEEIRRLWAQLIVNLQAGTPLNDYLLHVLEQLNSDEARYLKAAVEYGREKRHYRYSTPYKYDCPPPKNIEKMLSLGLLRYELAFSVEEQVPFKPLQTREGSWVLSISGDVETKDLNTTELAHQLYDAAMKPSGGRTT